MHLGETTIWGRPLVEGEARGELLVSREPISFFGGVDVDAGRIVERGHPLEGSVIKGKILIFPYGKGSTVGSYTLLRLKRRGLAPAGIVNLASEPIIIVGCIISSIPLMDKPSKDVLSIAESGQLGMLVVKRDKARLVVYGGKRDRRQEREA